MSQIDIKLKVIALYLLDKANAPLSNATICEFFVNGSYTDYFGTVSIINSLGESNLIDTHSTNNTTTHKINSQGQKTLVPMLDRISNHDREFVETFLSNNSISFKKYRELLSDYDRAPLGGYTVHLRANEDEIPIIDIHFHVGSEVQAKSICTNWKNNYEKVYEVFLENLI